MSTEETKRENAEEETSSAESNAVVVKEKKSAPESTIPKAVTTDKSAPQKETSTGAASSSSTNTEVTSVKETKPAPRPVPKKAEPKEEVVLEPSPLEPLLAQFKEELERTVGAGCIEEAYINRVGEHTPTFVVKAEQWLEVATQLKENELLAFNYVRNLSAVDYPTHMEMVYVLFSFSQKHQIALRVKLNREDPLIHTVSHLWEAANWNERECYDLFGIVFENHPNLKRILMPDHWEGYPLRKDYEPLDKEV